MIYILVACLALTVILLSVRLILLEERVKDIIKYLGIEQLFED